MCMIGDSPLRGFRILLAASGVAVLSAPDAGAQTTIYTACYVPSSGTIYRIREPGLRQQCGRSTKGEKIEQHVEFSWTSGTQPPVAAAPGGGGSDGNTKQVDHGSLVGLGDDDHSQYLMANGLRNTTNGFAVSGTPGVGSIPAMGPGVRLMWYPAKAAFRAGSVGTSWDDANIGMHSFATGLEGTASGASSFAAGAFSIASGGASTALGEATTASGAHATAMGHLTAASGLAAFSSGTGTTASGGNSTAMGLSTTASGSQSTAMGRATTASGENATAMGYSTTASGEYSTALGKNASTNGKKGAFVYGDNTGFDLVVAQADNQFAVRAQRLWFGKNNSVTATVGRFIETSTGAYLSTGGAWVSSSDIAKKTEFQEVDGEVVLGRLAAMPIRTWRYKEEGAGVRHMGPTAQDFRGAFGLGDTDKAIAGIDADGVSLAAIQALAKRTDGIPQLMRLVSQQDARIQELETALRAIAAERQARPKR